MTEVERTSTTWEKPRKMSVLTPYVSPQILYKHFPNLNLKHYCLLSMKASEIRKVRLLSRFQGWNGRGVGLTTHPILEPRFKKAWNCTYTPPFPSWSVFRVNFTFVWYSELWDTYARALFFGCFDQYGRRYDASWANNLLILEFLLLATKTYFWLAASF